VLRATVPEATIEEDSDFLATEDKVSCSRYKRERTSGDPVTQPPGMHRSAKRKLWACVPAAVALHACSHICV
jgi:hypothetical protein